MTIGAEDKNIEKLLSGEPLTYTELLQIAFMPNLEKHVIDIILSDQVKIDENSDDGPDFRRTLYMACLQQVNASEAQIETILEHALSDGEPFDVLSYWAEVIELVVLSKQLSEVNVLRVAEEIALFDYEEDDEIPPEMQCSLLTSLLASYSLPLNIQERVVERLSTLEE